MVYFHIVEEAKTLSNKCREARQEWMKISRKFQPTTGASKTRLRKKFSRCELDNVTRNPEECITELELLRGDEQTLYVHLDN